MRVIHLSVVHPPTSRASTSASAARWPRPATTSPTGAGRDAGPRRARRRPDAAAPRPRSRRWMSAREIVEITRARRPHVVHVHDPELLTLFPLLRAWVPRLVYDMHDYVPEQVLAKDYIPAACGRPFSRRRARAQRALAACGQGAVGAYPDDARGAGRAAAAAHHGPQLPARGALRRRRADPGARRRPAAPSRLHRQPLPDAGLQPDDRRHGAPRP